MDEFYKVSYETLRLADDLIDLEIEAINKIMDSIEKSEGISSDEFVLWQKIKEVLSEEEEQE